MAPSESFRFALPGLLLALFAIGGAGPAPVQAQEFGRIGDIETNTNYFYYAKPGEATIQVSLWGGSQSGIFEIPDSTALKRLLTISGGGGQIGSRSSEQKTRVMIRIYREGQARGEPAYKLRLRDLLSDNAPNPILREDDIVVVETIRRNRFTWRDGLSILTTAASLTLLGLRLARRL